MRDGPKTSVIRMAQSSPGGVIRWHEAIAAYRGGSSVDSTSSVNGPVASLLKKHFVPVHQIDWSSSPPTETRLPGFYVLKSMTEDGLLYQHEDRLALEQHQSGGGLRRMSQV